MPVIGVVAPNNESERHALAAARELHLERDVVITVGTVFDIVNLARGMIDAGIEVIVARGSSADFLIKSEPGITVVPITLSCAEMRGIVLEARRLTGLERPRIAIMSIRVTNPDVELFAETMGARLTMYPIIGTPESIGQALDEVGKRGTDVVVGGAMTMRMAEVDGIMAMPLPSSVESMKSVLCEAAQLAKAVALEQDRTRRFATLVRHLREGVLYVEPTGKIRIANPAAEAMLGRPAGELATMRLEALLNLPGLDENLCGATETVEEVVTVGDSTLIAAITPAHVGQEPSGVIVSLHETNRIAQMDSKIRRSQNARGLTAPYRFEDILGRSPAIMETKHLAAEYAATDSTVLLFGETGTGKELFAQSIHNASGFAAGPFVAVNCAALPPSLLESELFGYEEGAFTGANRRGKAGLIELAHNGTLFLDEVSEMDRYGQVRLLRFLQERQIMRLGGDKYLPVRTRVVAATNRDLQELVARKEFREDLYYRLKVLPLNLPPLRERREDIRYIVRNMCAAWEARLGRRIRFSEAVMTELSRYDWPGNVRELANMVECLAVGCRGVVTDAEMLRKTLRPGKNDLLSPKDDANDRAETLAALEEGGWNISEAARILGIHRSTLHRRMLQYKIGRSAVQRRS